MIARLVSDWTTLLDVKRSPLLALANERRDCGSSVPFCFVMVFTKLDHRDFEKLKWLKLVQITK